MMDWSSVVEAGLVVIGALTVLGVGLGRLSSESNTVSISEPTLPATRPQVDLSTLPKAA